ncbi:ubiquitin family protein [Thraustotheca clavata]|uniref:Ubiquitin family protein n=1 Tax=Thraustotheca clavata TaxID=74557 RepID=A0A1W0A7L9_9STRA|nr:ubiquitin family protein [Thraustotheca clavata]
MMTSQAPPNAWTAPARVSIIAIPIAVRREVRAHIVHLLQQRNRASAASTAHLQKVAARIDNRLAQLAATCAEYQDLCTLPKRVHASALEICDTLAKKRPAEAVSRKRQHHETVSVDESLQEDSKEGYSSDEQQSPSSVPIQGGVLVQKSLSRSYSRRTKAKLSPTPMSRFNGVIPMSLLCTPICTEQERLTLTLSMDTLGEMLSGQRPFLPGFTSVEVLTIEPSSLPNLSASTAICHAFASFLSGGGCRSVKSLTMSGIFPQLALSLQHPFNSLFDAFSNGACPNLTQFHCKDNALGDAGATGMSLWLANASSKLDTLSLVGNQIGDAGVLALAWAFSRRGGSITTIDLGQNAIQDKGAGALAAVFKSGGFSSLQVLHLRNNAIGPAGAKCLLKAIRSSPQRLPLREMNIDASVLQQLQKAGHGKVACIYPLGLIGSAPDVNLLGWSFKVLVSEMTALVEAAEINMELRIKTLNEQSFCVCVGRTMTVRELKGLLLPTTQVPEHRQRLIYRGKLLKDADLLSSYNVEDGHTLHMVAKPEQIVEFNIDSLTEPLLPRRNLQRPRLYPQNARVDLPGNFSAMRQRLGLENRQALMESLRSNERFRNRISPPATEPSYFTNLETLNQSNDEEPEPESLPRPVPNEESSSTRAIPNAQLEHLEQGLLTIQTLLSTAEAPHLNEARTQSERASILRQNRQFYIGQWLDVKDTVNQWLEGTVLNTNETQVFIHYHGWPSRWDEWIDKNSNRLAAFRTRTLHSSTSNYLSPTPVVRQPTAQNQTPMRTLLPRIRDALEAILPHVNTLASFCERNENDSMAEASDIVAPLFDRVGRLLADAADHVERMTANNLPYSGNNLVLMLLNFVDDFIAVLGERSMNTNFRRWERSANIAPRRQEDSTFRELIAVSAQSPDYPLRRNIDVHIHAILASPPPDLINQREMEESQQRWRELTERMQASLQRSLISQSIETSTPVVETPSPPPEQQSSSLPIRLPSPLIPELVTRRPLPSTSTTFLDVLRRTLSPLPTSTDSSESGTQAFFNERSWPSPSALNDATDGS